MSQELSAKPHQKYLGFTHMIQDCKCSPDALVLLCVLCSCPFPDAETLELTFLILVEGAGCKYLGCSCLPELSFKQRSFELELGK